MGLRLDVVPEELKEHEMEKDGFQMSVTSLNLRWGGGPGADVQSDSVLAEV